MNTDLQHIPNVIFKYLIMYIPKFVTVKQKSLTFRDRSPYQLSSQIGTLTPMLINYKLGLLIFLRQSIYLHTK